MNIANLIRPKQGRTKKLQVQFNRPANTTAYTANDAVMQIAGGLLQFKGASELPGEGGYIVKAELYTGQTTNTARFRLWLFAASSIANGDPTDNAAFLLNLPDSLGDNVGYIDFVACVAGADCAWSINADARLAYNTKSSYPVQLTSLYGFLQTLDGFTPTSQQTFFVELTVEES